MMNQSPMTVDPVPADAGFRPIHALLTLFSSVRLGITLMVVLFIYSSLGSAGIVYPVFEYGRLGFRHDMIRQYRVFELTEFEWFHTWFFNGLIALFCLNLVVATLRRIPLTVLSLGVWMIHSGIITLAIGSVIYFSTKIEGDAPVYRRQIEIRVPGAETVRMIALPGANTIIEGENGLYIFDVVDIQPEWPMLSAGEEGTKVYSVSVRVNAPDQTFIRQLVAGFPQHTQDVIPGRGRVATLPEFEGRTILDDSLKLDLALVPQDSLWVRESAALQIRPVGTDRWIERPLRGLPRYNDYISSVDHVWSFGTAQPKLNSISLRTAPVAPDDPLADADVRITGYLRYAIERFDVSPGGPVRNPLIDVSVINPDGERHEARLIAYDPESNSAFRDRMTFSEIESMDELATLREQAGRLLVISLPDGSARTEVRVTDSMLTRGEGDFVPLADSGWAYRIRDAQDRLSIQGRVSPVSILMLDLKRPDGTIFQRWVADDPARTRDMTAAADAAAGHGISEPSADITATYDPGRIASVRIVAVPEEPRLRALLGGSWEQVVDVPIRIGEAFEVGRGQSVIVTRHIQNAIAESRPVSVPPEMRNRDADTERLFAMIRLEVTTGGVTESHWLPFHKYSFKDASHASPVLSPYDPTVLRLADGREVEVIFSRQRKKLPTPVALEDFVLTTHVGGFSGRTSSIRDWTSLIRFQTDDGWTEPMSVSTNNPTSYAGFWYFQSYWEPPRQARSANDPGSAGMNFTGLGIGNRNGVITQLVGSCIAVIGMIYAFYVKPIIRRRRQQRVYAAVAEQREGAAEAESESEDDEALASQGVRS